MKKAIPNPDYKTATHGFATMGKAINIGPPPKTLGKKPRMGFWARVDSMRWKRLDDV